MGINVREHHSARNEKQLRIAKCQEVKRTGVRVPARNSHGLDANNFRDKYCAETWEYDLGIFDNSKVQMCTYDMIAELAMLLKRHDFQLPLNDSLSKISFKVSIQARFSRAAPKVKLFSIYVSLEKDFALRTFNAYKNVILPARYLSF
ncbi:hypothetical protein LTR22_022669 [Elasticomyces elasticus]|nr:hypothetical protein LTR22_022669 [Elasticomyces elasticus]KAK4918772.1 hypothetical protein LTR49_013559 [Elasticomyces elasticus]